MASKKAQICTLDVMQIEKNPALTLAANEKTKEKYLKVIRRYGTVTPVIVGFNGFVYR